MGKSAMKQRQTYKIHERDKVGEVQIADEVIAIIAALAATEVDGVVSMAGNITESIVSQLGKKNLSKGVRVEVTPNQVSVALALVLENGVSIPEVATKVQDRVQSAIEGMTGLNVQEVNICIAGIDVGN